MTHRDVYVSREVLEGRLPLRLVAHDVDGDWQFLSGSGGDELVHVPFAHVVERLPEASEFDDLETGRIAWRETADSPWIRQPQPGT